MKEPTWVPRAVVDHIQFEQIREHGGLHGLRDESILEASLARPKNKWSYEEDVDLPILAAAYGYGLATGHAFLDGNKRVAFMVMYVFLGTNGLELDAEEAEAVVTMLDLAAGKISETELAEWIRNRVTPL